MKDALFTEAPSSAGLLGKTRARSDASCAAFVVVNLAAAVDSADASLLHSVHTCTRTHARAHLPCTPAVHSCICTPAAQTCRAHIPCTPTSAAHTC